MKILGFEEFTYGVEEMAECLRFGVDFGFEIASQDDRGATLRTLEGALLNLRHIDDPALPTALEPGSTLREVVLGLEDQEAPDQIAAELARDGRSLISRSTADSSLCLDQQLKGQ